MPSVSAIVSGGISLGVIATFISGVYYVLIAGLQLVGKLQSSLKTAEETRSGKSLCARCGENLFKVKTDPSLRVKCCRCCLSVCRNCCSKSSSASWICSDCSKYRDITLLPGEWFYEQLKKRFHSMVSTIPGNHEQDVEVRNFMETIVEEMIGGELDDVSLRPLSAHSEYLKFCETHHDKLALLLAKFTLALQMAVADKVVPDSDSPSAVQEELKELIKRITKEAMALPSLQFQISCDGFVNKESLDGDIDEFGKKSYEDILATAVLNKIIERYQNKVHSYDIRSNQPHLHSSLKDSNGNVVRRRKLRRHQLKTTGTIQHRVDSDSDIDGSDDCSWSGVSCRTDPLSLTVEECFEEIEEVMKCAHSTDSDREDPEKPESELLKHFLSELNFTKRRRQRASFPEFGMDIVDKRYSSSSEDGVEEEDMRAVKMGVVEVVSPIESWEENWLFQRRQLKTACMSQSMPVPMLVPNPIDDEPRARIGDVDIDDTSDLSDCSDSVLKDIIDGSDPNLRKSQLKQSSINYKATSSENDASDSEDEFFLKNYNRNGIKSVDNDMKLKVNGICNGNITTDFENTNSSIINKVITHNSSHSNSNSDVIKETDWPSLPHKSENLSSSNYNSINEARNNELVTQVDSGEGSLEIQQDMEYTVEYDAPVQMHVNNSDSNDRNDTVISENILTDFSSNRKNEDYIDTRNYDLKPNLLPRNHQNIVNLEQSSIVEDEHDSLMMTPPRPGSIAEREHLKWQKAVPLSNNPYSKENIERRQHERNLLRCQSRNDISVEFPELTGADDSSLIDINFSGRKPDYITNKYARDYYINNQSGQKYSESEERMEKDTVEPGNPRKDSSSNSNAGEAVVKGEEKPQVSIRVEVEVGRWPDSTSSFILNNVETTTVSSINTRTDFKHRQVLKTISPSSFTTCNNKIHTKNGLKKNIIKDNDNVSSIGDKILGVVAKACCDDGDKIPLPSVKQLAKQFSTSDICSSSSEQVTAIPIPTAVQKRLEVQASSVKQVHSLTARCISKEFREGLRAANQHRTFIKSPDNNDNNCGNISDDSGTASPTPSGGSNPKIYNSIAFWEQMKSSR